MEIEKIGIPENAVTDIMSFHGDFVRIGNSVNRFMIMVGGEFSKLLKQPKSL